MEAGIATVAPKVDVACDGCAIDGQQTVVVHSHGSHQAEVGWHAARDVEGRVIQAVAVAVGAVRIDGDPVRTRSIRHPVAVPVGIPWSHGEKRLRGT